MRFITGFVLVAVAVVAAVEGFLGNDVFRSGDERLFDLFCVEDEEELLAVCERPSPRRPTCSCLVLTGMCVCTPCI